MRSADENAVVAQFGADFAREIFAAEIGGWTGPIESAFGVHLVRVDERQAGEARAFSEVSTEVEALWHRQRQDEGAREFYAALLDKYEVVADESVAALLGPLALAHEPQSREPVRR
jgi:parvulin-like peptidyl-prolyl isomerase